MGENYADDYKDMGQLDQYDSQMLDDQTYEDDVDARLAAEAALQERDRREGRRVGRLGAALESEEGEAFLRPLVPPPYRHGARAGPAVAAALPHDAHAHTRTQPPPAQTRRAAWASATAAGAASRKATTTMAAAAPLAGTPMAGTSPLTWMTLTCR